MMDPEPTGTARHHSPMRPLLVPRFGALGRSSRRALPCWPVTLLPPDCRIGEMLGEMHSQDRRAHRRAQAQSLREPSP